MKLPELPILPAITDPAALRDQLQRVLRQVNQQVNGLSSGRLTATWNAATAVPTTGTWAQGDQVKNSAPTEQGTAGSKYVIEGWICTAGGTPGTWVQKRALTGN